MFLRTCRLLSAVCCLVLFFGKTTVASEMTLYFVTTPGCVPCQQVTPLVDELIRKNYPVQKIDAATMPDTVRQLQVDQFPTFVMVAQNSVVDRVVGGGDPITIKPRILEMFAKGNEHLAKQTANPLPSSQETPKTFKTEFNPVILANGPPNVANAENAIIPASLRFERANSSPFIISSVKLRVNDAQGHSYGTGTIIDTRNGKALILTCGHVFRDSRGEGNIDVYLSGDYVGVVISGRCYHYDLEMDLGLVIIEMPSHFQVRAIPIAPANVVLRPGQEVWSVGCDGGADPTLKTHTVLSTDQVFSTLSNAMRLYYVQVSEAPVSGRSGGGLFSQDGQLIGVCVTADPRANDGQFVPTSMIRHFLLQKGLPHVVNTPSLGSALVSAPIQNKTAAMASESQSAALTSLTPLTPLTPSTPSPLQSNQPSQVRQVSHTEITTSLRDTERATLEEIKRSTQNGDEVFVIIARPNGSEIIKLNNVSNAFLDALAK